MQFKDASYLSMGRRDIIKQQSLQERVNNGNALFVDPKRSEVSDE
jgi:hypothetical protein